MLESKGLVSTTPYASELQAAGFRLTPLVTKWMWGRYSSKEEAGKDYGKPGTYFAPSWLVSLCANWTEERKTLSNSRPKLVAHLIFLRSNRRALTAARYEEELFKKRKK
jgi:hypothetical protein